MLGPDLEIRQSLHHFVVRGEELVQRRIDQADDHRMAVHGPEKPCKIFALQWEKLIQGFLAFQDMPGHMTMASTMGIRSASKNMCSVRQRPIPSAPYSRARCASLG